MKRCRTLNWLLIGVLTLGLCVVSTAKAVARTKLSPPDLCKSAAQEASTRTGVPFDVLWAVSLTETGTKKAKPFDAWPWTVNMEGKGYWFDSRDEALSYALQQQARGAKSFDLGCFQLNHRWHGEAFASVDAMFDPLESALYAAGFLRRLYDETGSWEQAAGFYHSRTPEHANRYRALFTQHLSNARQRIAAGEAPPPYRHAVEFVAPEQNIATATPRMNDFPLLRRGHQGALGSLVPLSLFDHQTRSRDADI